MEINLLFKINTYPKDEIEDEKQRLDALNSTHSSDRVAFDS